LKMYVGNLDFQTTDEDLHNAFTPYGSVFTANVMTNGSTGNAHCFGFVEMKDLVQAQAALSALEGHELRGRKLIVRVEKPALAPYESKPHRRATRQG